MLGVRSSAYLLWGTQAHSTCVCVCVCVCKRTWIWLTLDTKRLLLLILSTSRISSGTLDVWTCHSLSCSWQTQLELSEAKRETLGYIIKLQKWRGRNSLQDPKTEAVQFHSPPAPSWFQLSPWGCRRDTRLPHLPFLESCNQGQESLLNWLGKEANRLSLDHMTFPKPTPDS